MNAWEGFITNFIEVTRYKKYEDCAPHKMDPMLCTCKTRQAKSSSCASHEKFQIGDFRGVRNIYETL